MLNISDIVIQNHSMLNKGDNFTLVVHFSPLTNRILAKLIRQEIFEITRIENLNVIRGSPDQEVVAPDIKTS